MCLLFIGFDPSGFGPLKMTYLVTNNRKFTHKKLFPQKMYKLHLEKVTRNDYKKYLKNFHPYLFVCCSYTNGAYNFLFLETNIRCILKDATHRTRKT